MPLTTLMFGWEFPPHISGGLGTACEGLTRGLNKHGVKVIFVVPRTFGDEDASTINLINASDLRIDIRESQYHEHWKNMSVISVGSSLVPYLSPQEFYRLTTKSEHDFTDIDESVFSEQFTFSGTYGKDLMKEVARYALVASKIALHNDFDVIHAHDWLTFPAGIAAKKIKKKPLVVHIHATEFDRSGENINQDVYNIERNGMESADTVITVSNFTRDIVIERYGIDPAKIITVHNAVIPKEYTDEKYNKKVNEKIVTFLGRVTFQKGPEYFIEAASKVLQKDNQVRFVMAGGGDMLYRMIRRAARLKITTKFHFTGFLHKGEVDEMFAMSDVYVMPSVSEPFGISPLEAMRSGVPVIISKQSGVSEILHYALKVDFWDIDAISDCIYGLLHYPALSKMFSRYGKQEVDKLKWENAALKVKNVYLNVINGH
ncbi:MAG: 4-alpha-glucanotransferase [Bacteroidetes bacterium RIFCSPLOWO2_02_FULL_36_8]|nr:MAG: 4-alpha-glucanotransferase [Bacteroidetes bacterium RIFCSPLOWO2_02_FULL_36_8]OFY72122.1 MAG: 4-alpha-glucanotransferase [Bacteroidetes bacterium RIFCSPLOWO2_12_FULL_37_12]